MIVPATVRVTGDFMIWSSVLGGSFAERRGAGADEDGALGEAEAWSAAGATRAASFSRALSRSIGCAYFFT